MEIGSHESNFAFLQERDPRLAELGREAEVLASLNPNTCIMQVRLFAELLANRAATQLNVYGAGERTFFQTLERLEEFSEFGDDIQTVFHSIRQDANDVVHGEQYVDAKEERVQFALERIKQRRDWSGEQRKWLDRIGKTLITDELVPDPENLDHGAFRAKGGFDHIDENYFDGELREVLDDMNEAIWNYDTDASA